jgi:lysophospholipase L1-like esterase
VLNASSIPAEEPYWAEPMRKVHQGFDGNAGYVAQLGDSITYSMAFWTPIGWDEPDQYLTRDDGLPKRPVEKRWRDTLSGFRDKGPEHGNYSGWRVGNLLEVIDDVLKTKKPEMAIIMIGTNDISGGKVPEDYRAGLETVVDKCLAAHCVPILTTIPPRRDHQEAVEQINGIIREVAREKKVLLSDFYAECLRRGPAGAWDGTIISEDGVHPSGGETNVYTDENMKKCGYALRNWVNFLTVREVYFRAISPP